MGFDEPILIEVLDDFELVTTGLLFCRAQNLDGMMLFAKSAGSDWFEAW